MIIWLFFFSHESWEDEAVVCVSCWDLKLDLEAVARNQLLGWAAFKTVKPKVLRKFNQLLLLLLFNQLLA